MQNAHDALALLLNTKGFQQRSGRHMLHLNARVGVSATSVPLNELNGCPWTNLQYISRLTITFKQLM
jgi:hypothetical protein